jgi:hypothetical protein
MATENGNTKGFIWLLVFMFGLMLILPLMSFVGVIKPEEKKPEEKK